MFLPPSPPPIVVPAASQFLLEPTPLSLRFMPYPPRTARAPQKPRLPRRPSPRRLLFQGVLHRGPTRSRPPARPCPPLGRLALEHLRRRSRPRTAFPLGRADEQPRQPTMHPLLNCSSLIPSRVVCMLTGSKNSKRGRRAMPQCDTSLSAGRRLCHPAFCRATPHTSVPPFRTSRNWLVKDDYTRPTTASSYPSVIRRRHLTRLARWGERLPC